MSRRKHSVSRRATWAIRRTDDAPGRDDPVRGRHDSARERGDWPVGRASADGLHVPSYSRWNFEAKSQEAISAERPLSACSPCWIIARTGQVSRAAPVAGSSATDAGGAACSLGCRGSRERHQPADVSAQARPVVAMPSAMRRCASYVSSRGSDAQRASVGALWAVYCPCAGASHQHVRVDPDTRAFGAPAG